MTRTDEQLDASSPVAEAPGGRWTSARAALRGHRAVVAAVAVTVVVAVVLAALLYAQRTPPETVLFEEPPPAQAPDDAEPPVGDDAPEPVVDPPPADDAPPEGEVASDEPAGVAEPARIEVRDQRLYLVDADGQVLRTLHDEHDGSLEYTLRHVTLRPGSTTQDLAVAFVEGYRTDGLSVLVVRDGGQPELTLLTLVDHELYEPHGPVALPAGAWSPDGAMLAWLEPGGSDRAVLRAVRWSATGHAGDATPAGGIPIDPEGLMQADETRGLELLGWASAPEHLAARAYKTYEGGAERAYRIDVQRVDGHLQAQALVRT